MLAVIYTKQFKKDYKKLLRQNEHVIGEFDIVLKKLMFEEPLPAKLKFHKLGGDYSDCFECHVKPDLLLIWMVNEQKNILTLVRTGSHSELF